MALKIREVEGKLILEGNINSVTIRFLNQHIQVIKNSTESNENYHESEMNF